MSNDLVHERSFQTRHHFQKYSNIIVFDLCSPDLLLNYFKPKLLSNLFNCIYVH